MECHTVGNLPKELIPLTNTTEIGMKMLTAYTSMLMESVSTVNGLTLMSTDLSIQVKVDLMALIQET